VSQPTNLEMVCRVLKNQEGQTATRENLYALMCDEFKPWERSVFEERLASYIDDDACPIAAVKGPGDKVRYTGSERGGGDLGSGLYLAVEGVLRANGIPQTRSANREVFMTANKRSGTNEVWTVPDMVLECFTKSAGSPEPTAVLHTFEVEPEAGFSIQSVYQAHAQGRGADYSWVLFDRGGQSDAPLPELGNERINWAAIELGIGLISFSKPSVFSTWKLIRKPKQREHTKVQVEELREQLQ
jgi:hypothetical protein